jgi:hypothetical protein
MAITTRQTAIFGIEDWRQIYQTYREADFQSYDFETLRKSFIDYLRLYYPETFNDYIESSEFIALLDLLAFMGQAMAFRSDLNARENYMDTAERRDSVTRLAQLVSYTAKRNVCAQGMLKVQTVSTTENLTDYTGLNLQNVTVNWGDTTNPNWLEQWTTILNAALKGNQRLGRPGNRQNILGVQTEEYTLNLVEGFLPIVPYNSTVDGISMPFELVNSTSVGSTGLYEPAPRPDGIFNIIYQNDQLGYGSENTGFFFMFKQGVLKSQDFNLAERVANRSVLINIEGINNEDRWLFQLDTSNQIVNEWEYTESVYTAAVEQETATSRRLYSTQSRANDQITLTFGDGVFSEIPVGAFRAYVRSSNGLEYIINPEEMSSIVANISYVSRTGRTEVITFTCSLLEPVSNAKTRESIEEIKQRAPARYYTQNRMVNGEDYNLFPFTQYSTIIKSKAVARSAIGTSRYLELIDPTGKYSSTNVFASDGGLWKNDEFLSFIFTWFTINDIANVIGNQVQPLVENPGVIQFYYGNFPRPSTATLGVTWNQSTKQINDNTGYFVNALGQPTPIGAFASSNLKYIIPGALVKFVPPENYHFNQYNELVPGDPVLDTDKMVIWASPRSVLLDGTAQGAGNLPDGLGPVAINNSVPTGAVVNLVIPIFDTDIDELVETQMREQIRVFRNFGIGYNNLSGTWYLINSTNLAVDAPFSLANQGSTSGTNSDASWLVQFTTNGAEYTVTARELVYYFGSVTETRFFFSSGKVYDPRTGTTIQDFIKVLKTNNKPLNNMPLSNDVISTVIGQPPQDDGLINDFQVLVGFYDNNQDGLPDNPDFFSEIVAANSLVFLQKTIDFDDLERYLLIDEGIVNYMYQTLGEIEAEKDAYVNGQVFYATAEKIFYQLSIDTNTGLRTINTVPEGEYVARTGRQSLYFQYRHNSPLTSRIDPTTSNIIDVYIVTQEYYTQYQNWITDPTNTVPEPSAPTIDELGNAYEGLQEFKMISDQLILNSVKFKPLFGSKAASNLRGTIKVIRAAGSTASDSEIKNQVVNAMNDYFTIDKWNFGDTFYFSELAAFIHRTIGSIVSSVVLVPLEQNAAFGDLYEVRSAANEIFVNAATVADIEVINALTSTNLRTAPGSGVI